MSGPSHAKPKSEVLGKPPMATNESDWRRKAEQASRDYLAALLAMVGKHQ